MKHILFVLDYFTPHRGGVETVFENIIGRLLVKGYKISVLTSHYDASLSQKENHGNLYIYRIGTGRKSFMFSAIKTGIQILKKHHDISVIHGSTYGGAIPASVLGMLFRKKVVLTVHEVFGKLWNVYKGKVGGWIYRIFERVIFLFPYDVYHCVSRYTMNSLRVCYGIGNKPPVPAIAGTTPLSGGTPKLKMIYNGVDYDFWDPKKVSDEEIKALRNKNGWENNFVLLYYGHAGKSKGIDYLIEALPGILALRDDIVVVFNLIESKRLSQIATSLRSSQGRLRSDGQQGRIVVFNGFEKEELRRLVASVDAVIAPSISEGFGSVHTEACAMGKLLITTHVASIPEVVSGKIVRVEPASAYDLTLALSKITPPTPSKIEGDVPQKIFSWEETVEEIEKLY